MAQEPPRHGLYVEWGDFKAGVFGVPVVITVMLALVIGFTGRAWGLW
jgi:hypothetical protein